MELKELIKSLDTVSVKGDININIKDISYDSRKIEEGSLFVCIDGTKTDGHMFIPDAIEKGARALIVQKEVSVPDNITVILVENSRYALACVSDVFFNHPSSRFKLIGITGTKGKTTTTYMIKSILERAGQKVGLIGTIANHIGKEVIYTERTTPESYNLQSLFAEMADKAVDYAVMEVSSQGLALNRVSCTDFDIGVFTNFFKDHIAPHEHANMEEYFEAKMKLFKMCKKGLVNVDSRYSDRVLEGSKCNITTYGIDNDADIKAVEIVKRSGSVEFTAITPWFEERIAINIPGMFSVYNALAAIAVCGLIGISYKYIKEGLEKVNVPGRAEVVETCTDFTIMIDYAHTPDSLENILTTVRDFAPGRVISVFGCGGDRDKTKRPIMGAVSGKIAHFSIITSDNPRTEEPAAIVKDIEAGIKDTGGKYVTIVDRREAIKYAILNAKPGDIIVLAGKGHETYQTFKDKTIHFDEREVVKEILYELRGMDLE
jgi:UDP-N-acetylmuramoyl-L-alanyl-D-glutamate--2,6-diaminopimelate ligase